MQQKLTIPLLRFMYLICRIRTKRNMVNVNNGGKMDEKEFEKYSEIVKTLTNGKA